MQVGVIMFHLQITIFGGYLLDIMSKDWAQMSVHLYTECVGITYFEPKVSSRICHWGRWGILSTGYNIIHVTRGAHWASGRIAKGWSSYIPL